MTTQFFEGICMEPYFDVATGWGCLVVEHDKYLSSRSRGIANDLQKMLPQSEPIGPRPKVLWVLTGAPACEAAKAAFLSSPYRFAGRGNKARPIPSKEMEALIQDGNAAYIRSGTH